MITIQKIGHEDILDAKKLLKEVWVDTYASVHSLEEIDRITSNWHDPERLKKETDDVLVFFAVAKDKDVVVGVITAKLKADGVLDVSRLYIHPAYQRQGIGARFLEEAKKAFPEATLIQLGVEVDNNRAKAFYVKQGFQEVGAKQETIDDLVMDMVIMKKEI